MRSLLLFLVLLSNPSGDSDLEHRVMTLSQQFRCLVCQNETIADSHADLAADLRQQIREQMIAGRTDAEITTFLSDRYGDFVLYRPRVSPRTYALWFGPFAMLAAGLFALYLFLKSRLWTLNRRTLSADENRKADAILQFSSNPNVAVYRDQFAEIESDFRIGVIVQEEYERDRVDLKRRLLEEEISKQAPKTPERLLNNSRG